MVHRAMLLGVIATAGIVAAAVAQDPFEIQVYEYATTPKGRWNLETHFNYTARGTPFSEGQTHLTFELTRGLTEVFELAGYLVFARREGHGADFVAWRVRPRIRAPERWNLPVGLSLSTEVAFPRELYESEDVTLEVRPIIERGFGPVLLDLNPVIGRSLKGPGSGDGWDFEPGGRLGVTVSRVVDLSVEYYGSLGPLRDFLPDEEQVHQLFFGGDLQLRDNVVFNVGYGVGLTDAGNRRVLKARLGWLF